MRLHRLQVTAFGPFAGTETVDFEELNEAGLFLLSGATGAGKTSILDAVCFALYGTVPGVRGVKCLRSQHAPDGVRPETVLDFSVRGRRFVVRRSPEWSRPKRRGEGTRVEKACASLAEVVGGEERFLTSRAAEVGLQVSSLVGMRAVQFQQVAMLPQGEFQRFLQASSQDRHDVLQHLFQTDRFARIETWVHERSRELREQAASREQAVQRLVDALAERSGTELPASLHPGRLAASVGEGVVAPWADSMLADARAALAEAAAAHLSATAARTGTRTRLEATRLRARLHERRHSALLERAALAAGETAAAQTRAALDGDTRAGACLPVLDLLDRAEGDLSEALRARARLRDVLRPVPQVGWAPPADDALDDPETLRWVGQETEALLRRGREMLPRAQRLLEDTRAVRLLESRLDATETEQRELTADLERLPRQRDGLRTQHESAAAGAARHEALAYQLDDARKRLQAVDALPAARAALAAAEAEVRDARDRSADAREVVQDLTERRLAGMAAELAGELVDGTPCGVCGSPDHPAPARVGDRAVSVAEQGAAVGAHDLAQQRHLAAVERAGVAARHVETLTDAASGGHGDGCRQSVAELEHDVAAAAAAAAGLPDLAARLADAEERLVAGRVRLADLGTEVATTRHELVSRSASVGEARAALAELLGEDADPAALEAAEAGLQQAVDSLEQLRTAVEQVHRARARRHDLDEQAQQTARRHGLDSVAAVRAAVLAEPVRARLVAEQEDRAAALARVAAVLRDAEVAGVDDGPMPDVAAAEAMDREAEEVAAGTARTFHRHEQAVAALTDLRGRLLRAVQAWEPLRASSTQAESMSKLVRGMGSDNQLQMRLSAYVLARRLDQVLDAANERLGDMRDQRYLLQRTGRAARRSSQAGLGLEVLDQWTGDVRDPATLSGGETFVVSLALALGLADVVTHEAGGTEIETLFVDEGFGTLDADTLDDVMDRLDGLRAGGRTVGVVSHVSELRTRIPRQLHVHKSPHGSTVRQTTTVG